MSATHTPWNQVRRVAIIGTGLLGGSIGLAVKAAGFYGRVLGIGRTPETLEIARKRGCVDAVSRDIADAVDRDTLIVIATPVRTILSVLDRIAAAGAKGAIITDAGSTKTVICDHAARVLAEPGKFIGAHPMAGGEMQGPAHAKADLFNGRPCIVTPANDAEPGALVLVESFWRSLGMKMTRATAPEHDRMVANVSHLPHALASALVSFASRGGDMSIASTGFRDVSRLASSDPQLWTEIFGTNRRNVCESIDAFIAELKRYKALIGDEKQDTALRDALAASRSVRDRWLADRFGDGTPSTPDEEG